MIWIPYNHGCRQESLVRELIFKLIEVLVSISDCQDLISPIKFFLSFGLSARDILNNLFRFENKFVIIYRR